MEREDAKDLTLSILVVVVALLLADCIWLHVKCSREEADIAALAQDQQKTVETVKNLENWVSSSSIQGRINAYKKEMSDYSLSFMDKCRSLKNAAVKGYEAAKDELKK